MLKRPLVLATAAADPETPAQTTAEQVEAALSGAAPQQVEQQVANPLAGGAIKSGTLKKLGGMGYRGRFRQSANTFSAVLLKHLSKSGRECSSSSTAPPLARQREGPVAGPPDLPHISRPQLVADGWGDQRGRRRSRCGRDSSGGTVVGDWRLRCL